MDQEDALPLLLGGPGSIPLWNRWREASRVDPDLRGMDLSGRDLREASFWGANLQGANLRNAKLSKANLRRANLLGANLTRAKLSVANLGAAILKDADLSAANLRGVNLSKADLSGADLAGADLTGANLTDANFRSANLDGATLGNATIHRADLTRCSLRGANLRGAKLRDTKLTDCALCGCQLTQTEAQQVDLGGADLSDADLTLCRLIRCTLTDAVFDNAVVADLHCHDMIGSPHPPQTLRLDAGGQSVISGEAARRFFTLRAALEVYVTEPLTNEEVALYHFHIGELHSHGVASGVFLIGHRYDRSGSVLRFQAETLGELLSLLPDLLAPFRLLGAIDWEVSRRNRRPREGEGADRASAAIQTVSAWQWRLAERMADLFRGYRTSRIYRIEEASHRGFRLDLFTNESVAQRLSQMGSSGVWDRQQPLWITTGDHPTILLGGRHVSTQHFHGGQFQGCSFGDHNSVSNFFGVVDAGPHIGDDAKQKLKEARAAVDQTSLPDADKADLVEQLKGMVRELDQAAPDASRVRRFWQRIVDVAPTVAAVLSSAGSIARLLGLA